MPNDALITANLGMEPRVVEEDGMLIMYDEAGNITVGDVSGGQDAPSEIGWHDNLAEHISDTELGKLGDRLVTLYEADKDSRKDWIERLEKGVKLMGVQDDTTSAPFAGASRVIHPVISEAIVQFQARAIAELMPAKGPVKAVTIGTGNEEIEDRRDRVEAFMNYQYTEIMEEAFEEMDQLLFRLPLDGSAFKKVYRDPILQRTATRFVSATELVVPYRATDLATAARISQEYDLEGNEVTRLELSGHFTDKELPEVHRSDNTDDKVDTIVKKSEGRSKTDIEDDQPYRFIEMHVDLNLPGFEHVDADGEITGLKIPYIVHIEVASRTIKRITRNYAEDDRLMKRIEYFVHYRYLPGLGFYGFGLLHMIGSLSEAATGALRSLLDSAQFANMQGGFKKKTSGAKSGEITVAPGRWEDIETNDEDIRQIFLPLPYKEPSQAMFQLLGALVDFSQRFASTTEAMVGDANNTGPVGTTVALIEQGSKVFSAIHKRLHRAQAQEFRMVSRLNSIYLPDEAYTFPVPEGVMQISKADFDISTIDIRPVSDPNIFSATQRIAQGQSLMQLAESAPDMYDRRAVHREMLERLQIDGADKFLPDPDDSIMPLDPVSENMAALNRKPIRAFEWEAHDAHMQTHKMFLATLPADMQKTVAPIMIAHMNEHMAYSYWQKMQQAMGAQIPAPNLHAKPGEMIAQANLPPEMLNQIAIAAAQASQQLPKPPPSPEQQEQMRKDKEAEAKQKREDAKMAKEFEQKDRELDLKARELDIKEREVDIKRAAGAAKAVTDDKNVDVKRQANQISAVTKLIDVDARSKPDGGKGGSRK